MVHLIVFLALLLGTDYLVKNKTDISVREHNAMWIGIFGIGAVEGVAKLITCLVTGASCALMPIVIHTLIMGALTYYFYTKR